jgi:hypothetical protein
MEEQSPHYLRDYWRGAPVSACRDMFRYFRKEIAWRILELLVLVVALLGPLLWDFLTEGRSVFNSTLWPDLWRGALISGGVLVIGVLWQLFVVTPARQHRATLARASAAEEDSARLRDELARRPNPEREPAHATAEDAQAKEREQLEQRHQRELERPEIEEVRVVYRQVLGRAVVRACETAIDEFLLARAHGNRAYMLIRSLLNAYIVPPCRHARARLKSDLSPQAVVPLEIVVFDLQSLLTEYGVLIRNLEEAALAILGPQDLYQSEGYGGSEGTLGLYQVHRALLQGMDELCHRTAFESVRPALTPLYDRFTVPPLPADPPSSTPSGSGQPTSPGSS